MKIILNNPKHGMKVRDPLKYQIKKASTERYKGSSIIYMKKLLNEDHRKRKREMNNLNNDSAGQTDRQTDRQTDTQSDSLRVPDKLGPDEQLDKN